MHKVILVLIDALVVVIGVVLIIITAIGNDTVASPGLGEKRIFVFFGGISGMLLDYGQHFRVFGNR